MNDWRNDEQLLCHCHGIRAGVVRRVVRELRPKDPREVGAACKAGTGCRSCLPDIEAVMRQEREAARPPRRGLGALLARLVGRARAR